LSEFDRTIANAGDEEPAWTSALALVLNHIRNGPAWMAWAEKLLANLNTESAMFEAS
jgi:hypothetical protein